MNTTLITPVEATRQQIRSIGTVCEADFDKAKFSKKEMNCLLGKGDLIKEVLRKTSKEIIRKYLYSDEEVESDFTYPKEYNSKMLSIKEQTEILLERFSEYNLDATWALTKASEWYNSLNLPEWVEGPLVYIWKGVFGNYNETLKKVVDVVSKNNKNFSNYLGDKLGPEHIRQVAETYWLEEKIKKHQPGDLIVVPSQAGLLWRGKSPRRGEVLYDSNEFGLGIVSELCRFLTHPQRFIRWEQLHVDCSGDRFSDASFGFSDFLGVPYLCFDDGVFGLLASFVGGVVGRFGSSSGVSPLSL